MTSIAWYGMRQDDPLEDDDDARPQGRWVPSRRFHRTLTWIHVTRILGLAGLYYEIVVDQIDKPSVMIVLGAMILGTESIRNIFGGGGKS